MNETVFLLWHVHHMSVSQDEEKLIGVYRTLADAESAQRRIAEQPGFREHPDGFEIVDYTINKDHWTEGFVTV